MNQKRSAFKENCKDGEGRGMERVLYKEQKR
jgi:hypothetical protein